MHSTRDPACTHERSPDPQQGQGGLHDRRPHAREPLGHGSRAHARHAERAHRRRRHALSRRRGARPVREPEQAPLLLARRRRLRRRLDPRHPRRRARARRRASRRRSAPSSTPRPTASARARCSPRSRSSSRGTATTSRSSFTIVGVAGSFLVPYVRAKAEALGLRGDVGLGSRAERVVVITAGLVLAPWGGLPWAIYLLAATSWLTVVQRILHVRKQLISGGTNVMID